MKSSLLFSLLSVLALAFASCTKAPPNVSEYTVEAPPGISQELAPSWVNATDSHVYVIPASYLVQEDFVRIDGPDQLRKLTDQVVAGLATAGRTIPRDVAERLCSKDYGEEQLKLVKDGYFYSERDRSAYVRTRTVKNGVEHQYCSPPVLYELIAHFGAPLPGGYANALNYYPYGSSAGVISFADIQMAAVAIGNQTAFNLMQFDPDLAYPNTYPGTDDPIVFSPLTYEMIYPGTVMFDGSGPSGPFGSSDGSATNFVYVNTTPGNETFEGDNELPDWPQQDAVWHFPIPNLGPVYVLKLN